jgi:hypothetical protein
MFLMISGLLMLTHYNCPDYDHSHHTRSKAMGQKTRGAKAFAGIVALAAGFAAATLQPSPSLAELCGGDAGCVAQGVGRADHDAGGGNFSPPSS